MPRPLSILSILVVACFLATSAQADWPQQAKLLADDGETYDDFGWSVAISGNSTVVGANWDDNAAGSAYIFSDTGSGWSQVTKLLPSDRTAGHYFGESVDISGNNIIVGATFTDNDGPPGEAYIFSDTGSGWDQVAKLLPGNTALGDGFGMDVSISGNTAVIGSFNSAYVFSDTGSGWGQTDELLPTDGPTYFGLSVSIAGNTAMVGGLNDDFSGAVCVFSDTGSGWTHIDTLLPSDGPSSFGSDVCINGDTAIVGAYGSAYVFSDTGSGWTEVDKLLPSDEASSFGFAVSIAGDTAIVGAADSESAYVFSDTDSGWVQVDRLLGDSSAAYFGNSVSIDGGIAIVGSHYDDDNGTNAGAAYIFTPEPASLSLILFGALSLLRKRR